MLFPHATIRRIRSAVCAVGYYKKPEEEVVADPYGSNFTVLGTGFLVEGDMVVTARHVLQGLKQEMERKRIPSERMSFLFEGQPHHGAVTQYSVEPVRPAWAATRTLDLGISQIAPQEGFARDIHPVTFGSAVPGIVGLDLGAFGYPQGSLSLERRDEEGNMKRYRVGPVLQRGYVSAVAPFEQPDVASRYLLDMTTSPGMSGAPVFEPYNGNVIALHTAGFAEETAFAVPLTKELVAYFAHSYLKQPEAEEIIFDAPPALVDMSWETPDDPTPPT